MTPQPNPTRESHMHEVAAHRAALTGHCYRMLGSASEADDAVQETMLRAYKAIDSFEGRASLRSWLHRIATNVCLDLLQGRKARVLAMDLGGPCDQDDIARFDGDLRARSSDTWVEPIADSAVHDPSDTLATRQSIRLAFVAALQHLPPKQRAALLLTEVLDCSAKEVAETLESTVPAINSALQRARTTLASLGQAEEAPREIDTGLLDRFVDAFHRYDVPALTQLLRDDAVMSMPPASLWFHGPETIGAWLSGPGSGCRGSKLLPVEVCGTRGFAQYKPNARGELHAWALIVLRAEGAQLAEMTYFLDTAAVFPRFNLPLTLA